MTVSSAICGCRIRLLVGGSGDPKAEGVNLERKKKPEEREGSLQPLFSHSLQLC